MSSIILFIDLFLEGLFVSLLAFYYSLSLLSLLM